MKGTPFSPSFTGSVLTRVRKSAKWGKERVIPSFLFPDPLILNSNDEIKSLSLSKKDNSQALGAGTPGRGMWVQTLQDVSAAAGVYQQDHFSLLLPG